MYLILSAISKMNGSLPFAPFPHFVAPRGFGHQAYAPVSGVDADPVQHEFLTHSGNLSTKTGRLKFNGATFSTVVLLTVAAAVGFLAIQCFRTLTSGRRMENHGVASRRLAEGGEESCFVSHRVERAGQAAAWQAFYLPIAPFRRF